MAADFFPRGVGVAHGLSKLSSVRAVEAAAVVETCAVLRELAASDPVLS